MKKSILFIFILLFSISSAQQNEKFVRVDFSSICCGTPSEKPLLDYTKEFSQQNKLKKFEVWLETGLGYEGEFALFIGIDELNKTKKRSPGTKNSQDLKAVLCITGIINKNIVKSPKAKYHILEFFKLKNIVLKRI